jgi:nitrite reductase/ring-hydroxylating ferredoxin subunit
MSAPAHQPFLDRRRALAGAATVGIGVPLLAACSGDDGSTAVDPGSSGGGSSDGGSLTATSDIEVGGGTIFNDQQVVVTQPTKGEFKCFTAVCTHQGCIVSSVSGGDIHCECHGSAFSIEDGSVVNGPATQPLAEQQITVKGGEITLA